MGVSNLTLTNTKDVLAFYNRTCHDTLGLKPMFCDLYGFTALPYEFFSKRWRSMWMSFKDETCSRMTQRTEKVFWKDLQINRDDNIRDANKYTWQRMKEAFSNRPMAEVPREASSTQTGVILDLVNDMKSFNHTASIVKDILAPLHISLLQLRLADNHAFAVDLENLPSLAFSIEQKNYSMPNASEISALVRFAKELGVQTFPEISVSTNAAGFMYSGFVVNCPESYCNGDDGQGAMAADITRDEFLPVVYATIRELYEIFSVGTKPSIPYFHLGSDERQSNRQCFEESGLKEDPPYNYFESNLTQMMQDMIGLSTQQVMRWENSERVRYEDRTGEITHYPSTNPFALPKIRSDEPFVVTIDILKQESLYAIFKNTKGLMQLKPLAIFAELRQFDRDTWARFQVDLRLTAFHMGTKFEDNKIEEKGEFHDRLSEECERAGFDSCKQDTGFESISRWLLSEDEEYFFGSKKARSETCELFAEKRKVRLMKDEMIGDSDPFSSS